jgi:hypothetical protein
MKRQLPCLHRIPGYLKAMATDFQLIWSYISEGNEDTIWGGTNASLGGSIL